MGTFCNGKMERKICTVMSCKGLSNRMAEIRSGSQLSSGIMMVNKILVE